jgi:transcriptional regulator with XRE-family HTH domain
MAKNWREVRKEAVARGLVDEAKVAEHRTRALAELQAYRLADVRKAQHLTQVEVAQVMEVTQSRVSQLEKGSLEASEIGTVRKYVEALGGHLRVLADFGAAGSVPIDFALNGEGVVVVEAKRGPVVGDKVPAAVSKVPAVGGKRPALVDKGVPPKTKARARKSHRAAG